jgi:DNA-binding transcriptional ArsR family regulator
MKTTDAVTALCALAHEHRLAVYRLLVQRGPQGMAAGAIADKVRLVPSSLTFHLHALQRARLIKRWRLSRQVFYAADFTAMNGLVRYLTDNCCGQGAAGCDLGAACGPTCPPGRAA